MASRTVGVMERRVGTLGGAMADLARLMLLWIKRRRLLLLMLLLES